MTTAEIIGKKEKMSPDAVRASNKFMKAINDIGLIDPITKEKIMSEKVEINDEDVIKLAKLPKDKKIEVFNEISKDGDKIKISQMIDSYFADGKDTIPQALKLKPISINDSFNRSQYIVFEEKFYNIQKIDFSENLLTFMDKKSHKNISVPIKKCFWPENY